MTLLAAPATAVAGLKLVLKDGSYQEVRSYERKGDRVRYFSLERNDWEEVPATLVDWKATEEANRRQQEQALEKAREVAKEAAAEPPPGMGPEVAPGVRLPDAQGAYALVGNRLVEVAVSQADARLDRGRMAINILLPAPVLKNRKLVTLPGAKAVLQLEESPRALFVVGRASDTSRFTLLRVKVKDNARELEAIQLPTFGRKISHAGEQVEADIASLPNETTRLTPKQPLPAGEYAIVEFLGDKLNLYVWDFGVK